MLTKEIVNVKELTRILDKNPQAQALTIDSKFGYPARKVDFAKLNRPSDVVNHVLNFAENFPHNQIIISVNVSHINVNVMVSPVVGSA